MPKPPPKPLVLARATPERRSGEGPWASAAALFRSVRRRLTALEARPAPKEGPAGRDGAPGRDGLDGLAGRNGVDGAPGKDGTPGLDGKDGRDGHDGIAGRSIRTTSIDAEGRLVLAFSDGGEEIAGAVVGPAGRDGTPGRDGIDGQDGAPGRDGVPGKDGKDGAPGPRGERGLRGADGVSPTVEILGEDEAELDAGQFGRVRVTRLRIGACELSMLTLGDE